MNESKQRMTGVAGSSRVAWLCLLAAPLAGCLARTGYTPVCLSPDGTTAAHIQGDIFWPAPMPVPGSLRSEYVHWYRVDAPDQRRTLRIMGGAYDDPEHAKDLCFSPDSRRLAVLTRQRVLVVDTATGRQRQVARIESAAPIWRQLWAVGWLSDEEVCYGTRSYGRNCAKAAAGEPGCPTMTVYRCRLGDGDPKPEVLYRRQFPKTRVCGIRANGVRVDGLNLFLSPNGRYVLFSPRPRGQEVMLADMTTGKEWRCEMPGRNNLAEASWRRDGSAVFCRLCHSKGKPNYRYCILDARTGRARTVPELKPEQKSRELRLEPLWTADGKYVVAKHYTPRKRGWGWPVLIQPEPWKVIRLQPMIEGAVDYGCGLDAVRCCRAAGCLVVEDTAKKLYRLNYVTGRMQPIPAPELSRDGRLAVGFDEKQRRLCVHKLSAATTMPSGPTSNPSP